MEAGRRGAHVRLCRARRPAVKLRVISLSHFTWGRIVKNLVRGLLLAFGMVAFGAVKTVGVDDD
jgi:hypothetical protein